ncbi:hypothetical protein [Azovibrio restrictus]|uniref:hypothetical protein n=1 Tax=Azovibrio restrictus TaxID=146938 RepID=UPI0026EA3522|nr:hypothetical protein [Azovibrio restrictus]MDD3483447.1 hypothetical protein [Azovibrio restrictus]
MALRQRYLPLFELQAGMSLGRPVTLMERGVVVLNLPVGHVLTEASLAQLRARHAEYACISDEDGLDESLRDQEQNHLEARLAAIFRQADLNHPETRALYEAVLAYRAG